jgi:uncharacterized protein (DUF2252 family)
LLRVGETREAEEELCLIDIKEAIRAAAPRYAEVSMPRDNARRVVHAARALAPALGERMRSTRLLDRPVFVRELRPQDLKIEIEALTDEQASGVGEYLARIIGRAHAQQMNRETRRGWHHDLGTNRLKSIDTPNWFWSSIVRLLAEHETAYLEHCRRCALEERGRPSS